MRKIKKQRSEGHLESKHDQGEKYYVKQSKNNTTILLSNFSKLTAGFIGYYQYPGSHNGPNQVPYCNICRTSVYTLDIHTAELRYTSFDANSWTNGLLGATTGKVQQD